MAQIRISSEVLKELKKEIPKDCPLGIETKCLPALKILGCRACLKKQDCASFPDAKRED